jgi:penicillin V acylase-like amidase (Ntn superfamily)
VNPYGNGGKMKSLYVGCVLILAVFQAFACTEVTVANGSTFAVSARSMDYPDLLPTLVELAPRGVMTISSNSGITSNPPLQWVSKYGSVNLTPNVPGSTTVVDGMNEKGLICALLWDETAVYPPLPPPAGLPILSANDLPRYFIDNFATVNEALASLSSFYIIAPNSPYYGPVALPLHFTLHDATGDSALIEFDNGIVTVTHPLPRNVTTNEPQYSIQLANLNNYAYFNLGGTLPLPGDIDSISRFVRSAAFLSTTPISSLTPDMAVSVAFGVLFTCVEPLGSVDTSLPPNVGVAWPTQWIRAYDNINLVNYYGAVNDEIFSVDMSKINFSSRKIKHRYLNLYLEGLFGDVTVRLLLGDNFY